MTDLQPLQQKRAELLAEQEALSTLVPRLEAAWKAMPSERSPFGGVVGSPEQQAAMEEASKAAGRLYNLPRLIDAIEQEIAYAEKVAQAEGDIARHNAETQAAEVLAASLEQQLGQLTARLESLRNEVRQAQEEAEQGQQEAAQAIARAAASGDGKAEKAAQAKLGQAVEAARAVGEKTRTGQIVIDALTREATALEERLSAARQQAESARLAALRATTTQLQAEWNAAAEALAAIGAQLIETTAAMGSPYHGLAKLLIPTFGPHPSHLNQHSLRRRGAEEEAA
jgi:chromosome segregation ATPase